MTTNRNRRLHVYVVDCMKVLVCHRQKTLVHLAKINGRRHGVDVVVARNGAEVVELGRREHPQLIVLGDDLEEPTTEETKRLIRATPELRGVEVIVAQGVIDLLSLKKSFPFPWPKAM